MKIDCHIHVNWLGYGPRQIVEHMDRLGIDRAWVHTWEMVDALIPSYQHLSAASMWAACREFPERFIPFYAPDPRRPDAVRVLEEAIEQGLKGVGECKFRICIDNPDLLRMFRIAGDAGLPVLLHLDKAVAPDYGFWYLHGIDGFSRVLDMLPDVNFVGHGPGFWRYVSADEAGAREGYPTGPVLRGDACLNCSTGTTTCSVISRPTRAATRYRETANGDASSSSGTGSAFSTARTCSRGTSSTT